MEWIAGRAWTPDGFVQAALGLEDGRVRAVEDAPDAPPVAEGLVVPAPVNAHTHVGDALARGPPVPRDLEAAVAPPDGLKHRILRDADEADVVAGIRDVAVEMLRAGTRTFLDFRENGLRGLDRLAEAVAGLPCEPVTLARPGGLGYDEGEVAALLARADGLGLSGIGDVDPDVARALADHAHRAGALFALHASEGTREPVDRVLALDPAFVVHMVHATGDDLDAVAGEDVGIVVCPRSNAHFADVPPVGAMRERGIEVALGSDNAMLHEAHVLEEAAFLHEARPDLPADALVDAAVAAGHRLLDRPVPGPREGARAELVVLEDPGGDPYEAVLGRPEVLHAPWFPLDMGGTPGGVRGKTS